MKKKTTRQLSDAHENYLVKVMARWNARRSSSSGAMFNDPNDVTTDLHVIECKATEGQSLSLKREDWLKIQAKAYNGKGPMMSYRFADPYGDKHIDLVMITLEEYMGMFMPWDPEDTHE